MRVREDSRLPPISTALQHVCDLRTPSPLIDTAFRYAKDNIARCMRYYSLGWGMSNSPHTSTIVVGRDTGWMCLGIDYVASWFAPKALGVFRDRQKANGQILEYIDLESGVEEDYGLNVSDNTPHYIWGVWHHWQQYADQIFLRAFLHSVLRASDYLLQAIGPNGLLCTVPAGVETRGISSWRNIIPGAVCAGEVTEINALTAMSLRMAAEFTGNPGYADAAQRMADAINEQLWTGDRYLLNRFEGADNLQMTGDAIFPVLCGIAPPDRARSILDRLGQPDFWNERGLRTVPNTDPAYDPLAGYGLTGGSWPNLTLWYAAAIAPYDPDRALKALETVARPVVEECDSDINVRISEFAEFFHGDTGINRGMHLSPWVAPTFIWAVMEGLLGLTWKRGVPSFRPHWPSGWQEAHVSGLPTATGRRDILIERESS